MKPAIPAGAWSRVFVSVESLVVARQLWVDTFGFEPVEPFHTSRFSAAWALDAKPADIEGELLVTTPGQAHGQVHFVQFRQPGWPVRKGAATTDQCAKNLDLYVDDLPARAEALRQAGCRFRNNSYSEMTAPDGTRFREWHMHGHDGLNIVLLQLLDENVPCGPAGFGGIGALVTIVPDCDQEMAFYNKRCGTQETARHTFEGPEIERMIGLPPGASLDVRIAGHAGDFLGQMEVITYKGAAGANLYPVTRVPARGILAVAFEGAGGSPRAWETPAGFRVLSGRIPASA